MNNYHDNETEKLINGIVETYHDDQGINFIDVKNLPVREKIIGIIDIFIELLFPGYTGKKVITQSNVRYIVGEFLTELREKLAEQVELAYRHDCRMTNKECGVDCDCEKKALGVTRNVLAKITGIRHALKSDVNAAFDGDPAAKSFEEIVISYPGLLAITIHRIAHELYLAEVPLIPRIMSEHAHTITGIDIHPGAKIGESFFIDHGTGVVIGETAVIGNNVKLYQGVTLGALSFPKDERGRVIKGNKRHPTIEDEVTIYAEATILGDITIGRGSVISGNSWVMKSVPPGVTVVMRKPESKFRKNRLPENVRGADEFLDLGAYI